MVSTISHASGGFHGWLGLNLTRSGKVTPDLFVLLRHSPVSASRGSVAHARLVRGGRRSLGMVSPASASHVLVVHYTPLVYAAARWVPSNRSLRKKLPCLGLSPSVISPGRPYGVPGRTASVGQRRTDVRKANSSNGSQRDQ